MTNTDNSITVEVWVNEDGEVHRDNDQPAVLCPDGDHREWFKGGKRHRDGGLPAIESRSRREWFEYGKRHRDGGLPAVEDEFKGDQWWVRGHRQDVPVERAHERRREQALHAREHGGRFVAKDTGESISVNRP